MPGGALWARCSAQEREKRAGENAEPPAGTRGMGARRAPGVGLCPERLVLAATRRSRQDR